MPISVARGKLYPILNNGCDDTTRGLVRMTYAQFDFFKAAIENLNKNSTYRCMPKIEVYRIDEDSIREFTDEDCDEDCQEEALYLDDRMYVLKDGHSIWSDDFKARKVIG